MNINNLFRIADAAKHIQAYDIANAIFAVIAQHAINNQSFGRVVEPNSEAQKVHFQIEMQSGDDLIGSLAHPNTVGYYDLPRLMKWGDPFMGTRSLEAHVLCIPLPLVSRYFSNMMIRLMGRETYNMGPAIIERPAHERSCWRLGHNPERVEACRRDLQRRLLEEVSRSFIDDACYLVLAQPESSYNEPALTTDDEPQWLGPATLAKLTASVEDFEALEIEEYEYAE